jgi:hypothetical protein
MAHVLPFPRVHVSACGPARRCCSTQSLARSAAQPSRPVALLLSLRGPVRCSALPRRPEAKNQSMAHPRVFAVASPRPGRNLGLGRERSPPPGPKEARPLSAVHVDRRPRARVGGTKSLPRRPENPSPILSFLSFSSAQPMVTGGGEVMASPERSPAVPRPLSFLSSPHPLSHSLSSSSGRPATTHGSQRRNGGAAVVALAGVRMRLEPRVVPSSGAPMVPSARAHGDELVTMFFPHAVEVAAGVAFRARRSKYSRNGSSAGGRMAQVGPFPRRPFARVRVSRSFHPDSNQSVQYL